MSDLGIDDRVVAALEAQGIESLYPPQEEAWKALRDGSNVVVAVPTASGKSLVAYLALLRNFLETGRKGLFIVPLRALASEKFHELRAFRDLGLRVGIATGDLDEGDPKLGANDVIVCTSEKADSLLRHRVGWVEKIGCVVADELHLVHDPGRGPTLEVLLSRFRALYPETQIVGLSATIANAEALARWLDAQLVRSDWRPVDLHVGTYFGDRLDFVNHETRHLESGRDPVAALVEDAIRGGGQCLVFCSTRRGAESQATRLGGVVRDLLDADALAALEAIAPELDDGGEGSPTAKKLQKLVTAGVAYHTAGLDARQRRFIEQNFRDRKLKVLCATPTLAAGVNTPARRVIIRDLTRFEMGYGSRPLPVMEVQQMMGRAGRPRYDPYGEAVLVCKSMEVMDAARDEYLHGEPEPIASKLGADAALRIHTLASIAGGYCDSEESLGEFLSHTFWAEESQEWVIADRLDDVLWFLEDNGFVERDGGRLRATLFGKRTSDLYIDPFSALRLKGALHSDRDPTTFGLLEVVAGCPDVYPLYLRKADDWVAQAVLQRMDDLLLPDDVQDGEQLASFAKTAMLLSDWCNEESHGVLEERYQVGPGDIRMRVESAGWLVHAFRELARAFRPDWQKPLTELGQRLDAGIKAELLPLIALRGVGRIRARTLHANGFTRPRDLKDADPRRLAALPGLGPKVAADLLKQVGVDVEAASTQRDPSGRDAGQSDDDAASDGATGDDPSGDGPPGEAADRDASKGQVRLGDFEAP